MEGSKGAPTDNRADGGDAETFTHLRRPKGKGALKGDLKTQVREVGKRHEAFLVRPRLERPEGKKKVG